MNIYKLTRIVLIWTIISMQKMLKEQDGNGDGMLNKVEFKEALKKNKM